MASNKLLSLLVLYPISKIYGMVMSVRNFLFDRKIFVKPQSFDIPIVVVGNITMGGAGKTPHTEYIVEHLMHTFKIGVLSRGYKRKTHGFVEATPHSHPDDVGDEPYQIYRKFRSDGVMVAVCENRVKGIEKMREIDPSLQMIVLDDAFQHRYVTPTVSVVLMEYNRPAFNDHLLPYGRLREPVSALNRADIIVVTKCPDTIRPIDFTIMSKKLDLFPYQKLLFSTFDYQPLVPLFPDDTPGVSPTIGSLTANDTILALSGVANPKPFVRYLRTSKAKIKIKRYADHHQFSESDMQSILAKFNSMPGNERIIVTTEKDAVRLLNNPYFPHRLRPYIYYVPVKVKFIGSSGETPLEDEICHVIRTNRILKGN